MTRPRAESVADQVIAADTARAATIARAGKPSSGLVTDGGSGIPSWLIGLVALMLVIALGGGLGYVFFGGGEVAATPTAPAVAAASPTIALPVETVAPPIETVAPPVETIAPPVETAFACVAAGGIADYLAANVDTRSAEELCEIFEEVATDDPPSDQFAQDALVPGLADLFNDIDDDFLVSLKNQASWSAWDMRNEMCIANLEAAVQVLCGDKVPPPDAVATVSWVHLAASQSSDGLYSMGLNVRYDSSPGRAAPVELPLLVSQNAQRLYTSAAANDGTFEPPVFTDFRTNSGALSDHVQLVGPDWFAFITFDDGVSFLPWICQFDTAGQGNEHQACDIPGSATASQFAYLAPVEIDISPRP